MDKSRFYVGLDVGQKEIWAAMAGFKARAFNNTPVGIKSLHAWAKKQSGSARLHFCMEATGVYSLHLAGRLLSLKGVEISIVNPAQIKSFARAQLRRTKTDAVDAQVILEFAQSQNPPLWQPPSETLQNLYHLVACLDGLKKTLRILHNRHHTQSFIANLSPSVKKSAQRQERFLQKEIARIEKDLHDFCQTHPQLQQQIDLLETIPGIGPTAACQILAYAQERLTKYSARQLTAHAGLAPAHRQSGTSLHGKSHLAKQGDRRLRKILYMPAVVAIGHNPILNPKYQALLNNGKTKMVALMAIMRKLLLIIRAILITQKPFNPNIIPLT